MRKLTSTPPNWASYNRLVPGKISQPLTPYLPRLVKVFKEEVTSAIGVRLTDKWVQKSLQPRFRRCSRTIACVTRVRRFLQFVSNQTHNAKGTTLPLANLEKLVTINSKCLLQLIIPVSAMYILGLLESAVAASTLVVWKNEAVQPAASSALTFANQGCTLAICNEQCKSSLKLFEKDDSLHNRPTRGL